MKTCPRCDRSYPDSETFCEADGSPLVPAEPAFARRTSAGGSEPGVEARIECPVCGGKAEPGEVICNFCGARLAPDEGSAAAAQSPRAERPAMAAQTQRSRPDTMRVGSAPLKESEGRSIVSIVGYTGAAIIALAAGAWFALHLSAQKPEQAGMQPSPVAAPSGAIAPSGPVVVLANTLPVQVLGESANSPERSGDVVRKVFDDN